MDKIAEAVVKWQADEDELLNAIQMSRQQEKTFMENRASSLSDRISRFFDKDKKDDNAESYTGF
jgi:hypothetical protein